MLLEQINHLLSKMCRQELRHGDGDGIHPCSDEDEIRMRMMVVMRWCMSRIV